jgi:hypothetical protein
LPRDGALGSLIIDTFSINGLGIEAKTIFTHPRYYEKLGRFAGLFFVAIVSLSLDESNSQNKKLLLYLLLKCTQDLGTY